MSTRERICSMVSIAALAWSCGGKAVVDGENEGQGGAGGTTTTTTHSTTSTGSGGEGASPSCNSLSQALTAAIDAAQECNPAINTVQCNGSSVVRDSCACELVANENYPALVQAANGAYNAWVAAGCGPIPCYNCPPAPPSPWYCDPSTSSCQPAYEL